MPLPGSGANLIIHTFRTGPSGTDTPEVRFALPPQVDRRQITSPDGNAWNPALASRQPL
jgi:hypothetical protein